MTGENLEMPRSAVLHPAGTRRVRDVAEADQLEVSVYLRPYPREAADQPAGPPQRESHEQMRARRVVEHAAEIAAVTAFAAEHGLRVVSAEPERRLVRVAGPAGRFGAAFGVTLGVYDAGDGEFRSYSGALHAPAGLADSVESVLGLDDRPVARPYARYESAPGDVSFRPNKLAELYHFPENLTGWLRCTGIIELGGGWGRAEKETSSSYRDSMTSALADAAGLGISVFVASGDLLASDGIGDGWAHVDFPASSPWAIGCGGTAIEVSGSRITREVVWSHGLGVGTGGGISDVYDVPLYQSATKLPPSINDQGHRRGVPDVAGVASSVHEITVDGEVVYASGTSAVAPLWAGLGVPEGGQLAILLACKCTRLTPLTAVAWADGPRHMRVFCHTTLGELSEFRCDDSWQPGATLPGPAPASKLSAVEWNDAQGVHLRIYYQDTSNMVREHCYDNGRWQAGATLTLAAAGTGLAALAWADSGGAHIRVYYAVNDYALREQCFDGGPWQPGRFAVADAAPGTSLAAVGWLDGAGLHQRVYYQDGNHSIREQYADHGVWDRRTVASRTAIGSGLGALHWSDANGAHERVFYHDRDKMIREQWTDGGPWQPGPFVLPAA